NSLEHNSLNSGTMEVPVTMKTDTDKRAPAPAERQEEQVNIAMPQSIQTESDLSDREESDEFDEDHRHEDYSDYTKAQFVDLVKQLAHDNNLRKVEAIVREIK